MIIVIATTSYGRYNIVSSESSSYAQDIYLAKQFYVGIGASPMELLDDGTDETFKTTSASILIGYQYNKYLAVEGRYSLSVGKVAYHTTNTILADDNYPTDFTNVAIYLKPIYPIGYLSLYGLIGYGEVGLTNIPKGDVDRAEAGGQFGAGVSYKVNKNISIFMDYISLYDGRGFDHLGTSYKHQSTMSTFGASYKF